MSSFDSMNSNESKNIETSKGDTVQPFLDVKIHFNEFFNNHSTINNETTIRVEGTSNIKINDLISITQTDKKLALSAHSSSTGDNNDSMSSATSPNYSLIMLNSNSMDIEIIRNIWSSCNYRICADGGANRYAALFYTNLYLLMKR